MSKWQFDWSQESTKRGVILIVFGSVALIAALIHGETSSQIVSAGMLLAGGMGAARSD